MKSIKITKIEIKSEGHRLDCYNQYGEWECESYELPSGRWLHEYRDVYKVEEITQDAFETAYGVTYEDVNRTVYYIPEEDVDNCRVSLSSVVKTHIG